MKFNHRKPFIKILLLDCCRTYDLYNPDLNEVPSNVANSRPIGLAEMGEATSLIAFACARGTIAIDDKKHRNGLFTKHLLKHIITPNHDIRILLADVTKGVEVESKLVQSPFLNVSLVEQAVNLCVQPTGKW